MKYQQKLQLVCLGLTINRHSDQHSGPKITEIVCKHLHDCSLQWSRTPKERLRRENIKFTQTKVTCMCKTTRLALNNYTGFGFTLIFKRYLKHFTVLKIKWSKCKNITERSASKSIFKVFNLCCGMFKTLWHFRKQKCLNMYGCSTGALKENKKRPKSQEKRVLPHKQSYALKINL